jgi:ribonuclease HII
MPDFSLEQRLRGTVAGIDEAGRGPWAGPVVAGAAVLDRETLDEDLKNSLNDSKQLSASARETIHAALEASPAATFAIGVATVEEIDAHNILQATYLAMQRAVEALADVLGGPVDAALVDGNQMPRLPCAVQSVVKGDSRSLSIAAASIVAKVSRDRMMAKLAREFPGYGWETNQGYGTAEHKIALDGLGVTPHHRTSYAPVRAVLARQEQGR